VTAHSGIVTGDSGHGQKSVTFNRNRRSRSVGTTGHVQTESEVKMERNTHIAPNSPSNGVLVAFIEVNGAPVELMQIDHLVRKDL
jgi:hypothetical protein